MKEQTLLRQSAILWRCKSLCRGEIKRIRQEKGKACAGGHSDNRQTERTHRKCFRCGSEDHLISKFPKPPKENEKRRNQLHFYSKSNRVCDNRKNISEQEIYASMARMYVNDKWHS